MRYQVVKELMIMEFKAKIMFPTIETLFILSTLVFHRLNLVTIGSNASNIDSAMINLHKSILNSVPYLLSINISFLTISYGVIISFSVITDMKNGTVFTLLSQPITKNEWLLTKLLAYLILSFSVLGSSCLVITIIERPFGFRLLDIILLLFVILYMTCLNICLVYSVSIITQNYMFSILISIILSFLPRFINRPDLQKISALDYIVHPYLIFISNNFLDFIIGISIPIMFSILVIFSAFQHFKQTDINIGRGST